MALNWEKVLYLSLIALALMTRLWGLGMRVQSHDESLHTKFSWNLYVGQGFQHTPLMHGPFLFHATALSYFLFGDNDFTARLVVALIGVAIVAFPYLLRHWLGRVGALVASFLLLISPLISYYSRYIRHDIPVMLWALIVFLAIFGYLRDGRQRWITIMAAGVALMFATKEVAFIYLASFGLFLIGAFGAEALGRDWGRRERLKPVLGGVLIGVAIGLLVLGIGVLSSPASNADGGRAIPWWGLAGGGLAVLAVLAGATLVLVGMGPYLKEHRLFDLIIVLGTLCLPFLSPLVIQVVGLDPMDYTTPTIYYSGAILAAVVAVSAVIGAAWDWRRWIVAAAVFYAIGVVLFTTVFTYGGGIASGFIGSLGYWLAQHGVRRGDQPWYYYGIIVPLYEYLPLLLSVAAGGTWAIRAVGREARQRSEEASRVSLGSRTLFIPFVIWWTVTAWTVYSWAGEKMPWLAVHLSLPMIFLGAWGVGRFIEGIDWRRVVRDRIWLAALLVVPLVAAVVTLIAAIAAGPFRGSTLAELTITGQFLGSLVATVAFGGGLLYVVKGSEWGLSLRVLLLVALLLPTLLTVRHAWRFNFINYDFPIEHGVYAHAGPAVKETMAQIEELSRRVVGGPELIEVAFGADGSWPFHWYLRNYRNATFYGESPTREQMEVPVIIAGRGQWDAVAPYTAGDYLVNTYTYLWWPIEDYRGLTWQRIRDGFLERERRVALWRIWYDRDYSRYDEVTGRTHRLDEWPLRSDYRLYIRRDVIAQMWEHGALAAEEWVDPDPYAQNHVELTARTVFGAEGSGPGQLQTPRGVAVGPDGSVYVTDGGNQRVQRFESDGAFLEVVGERELQPLSDPWDVAVAPDGSVYIADTWNHRMQRLAGDGGPALEWGVFGQANVEDGEAGHSLLYGPRGVAVGPSTDADPEAGGLVYVTDTGNKRVQVFEATGAFAFQFGGGGIGEGRMDEPVGIAFGPEGNVYVADTWNRRVQVFDASGTFLRAWRIEGWDTGLPEEKPFLAVDRDGRVYVTDPGHYRVLVFDGEGEYLLSFGRYGVDARSFALPQGIAVTEDGTVYVTDAHAHRVLVFDPIDFARLTE